MADTLIGSLANKLSLWFRVKKYELVHVTPYWEHPNDTHELEALGQRPSAGRLQRVGSRQMRRAGGTGTRHRFVPSGRPLTRTS